MKNASPTVEGVITTLKNSIEIRAYNMNDYFYDDNSKEVSGTKAFKMLFSDCVESYFEIFEEIGKKNFIYAIRRALDDSHDWAITDAKYYAKKV
jgi:hypothetical protein